MFQAIWDSDRWPSWWRGVEAVTTLEEGDGEGVGSLGRYVIADGYTIARAVNPVQSTINSTTRNWTSDPAGQLVASWHSYPRQPCANSSSMVRSRSAKG